MKQVKKELQEFRNWTIVEMREAINYARSCGITPPRIVVTLFEADIKYLEGLDEMKHPCFACEDSDWIIKWNAIIQGSDTINNAVTIAKFCPECGRKLSVEEVLNHDSNSDI